MSVVLYRLGAALARRPVLVVGLAAGPGIGVLGASMALGDKYDDSFSIPGTESQEGQDILLDRFDQSGTSAQVIFTAGVREHHGLGTPARSRRSRPRSTPWPGSTCRNPLGPPPGQKKPILSQDGASTLGPALFDQAVPSDKTLDAVQRAAAGGARTSAPRSAATPTRRARTRARCPSCIGLLISFFILAVTFGSLLAAGMPIITALVGVAHHPQRRRAGLARRHGVQHLADAGGDAGPGGRHRLRPLHPVALPAPAARSHRDPGGGHVARPRDRRQRRRVRRDDRRHRAVRPRRRTDPGAHRHGDRGGGRGGGRGRRRA